MAVISVLTSSRADYGIYIPLLRSLQRHPKIKLQLLVFGTHTAKEYGHTLDAIKKDGFVVTRILPFVLDGTSPASVAKSMALTTEQFAGIWEVVSTDLIICLGDRYEMFAAVASSVPFRIPVLHIHGGETTLGAIDNVFRHCLTQMSVLHFAACETYRQKIIEITGTEKGVFNTGALSIDNLREQAMMNHQELREKFGVDFSKPTILFTFHPETVSYEKNELFGQELITALRQLSDRYQLVITMPNADTRGAIIRAALQELEIEQRDGVYFFENLGMPGYLSAMNACSLMLGNTSSGFIEASYFPKWVVNLGDRQKGRLETSNIVTISVSSHDIVETVDHLMTQPVPVPDHPYGNGHAAERMVKHLEDFLFENKTEQQF